MVGGVSERAPAVIMLGAVGWEGPATIEGGFVLPSGTVTLLLGDVEGSTRAWQANAAAAAAAMAEMNGLVDELVGRFDGARPLEQGEGDSFVAAFARARDGVGCALEVQRRLAGAPLRLRLSVHTGDLTRSEEGTYAGPVIIRAARLRNVAHGGQTVLSEATQDLVVDGLPEGAALRDLGVHRLKDLSRPERIYQLCHPDLADEFPALRSLDSRPHNLPVQRTSFIGRQTEVAELTSLVGREPLLTLAGSGGCGKTRLALQVAAELLDGMADGVWFVDLAAVAEGQGVVAKAAQTLGVLAGPAITLSEAVVAHLRSAEALLVVDNCEHVLEAAAGLVDDVLAGCQRMRVVTTSRQPLGVDGEVVWRVPSLSLPADLGPAGIEGLSSSEAVELFVERAGRARTGFRLDAHNRNAVAEICRRLDGIPLAIELAAARTRVLTPAQIADGLTQRFRLLTGSSRTALPRQQTLEASLDWSHALLTDLEQVVFRQLGVFAASFDLDAAVTVCGCDGIEPWQVLDLLTLLVDKNLVSVDDSSEVARYRLLETMRLYAQGRLDAAGDTDRARTRHRDQYLNLAESAKPHLEGTDALGWVQALDLDWPNLEAALTWCHSRGESDELRRLVMAVAPLWGPWRMSWRQSAEVGAHWVDTARADLGAAVSLARAELCWARSAIAYSSFDLATTAACAQEGLAVARQLDDDRLIGRCLIGVAWARGHLADAGELWAEAIAASRRAGDVFMLHLELSAGVATFYMQRDPVRSRAALNECWQLAELHNWPAAFASTVWVGDAWLNLLEGRVADAIAGFDRARQGLAAIGGLPLVAAEGLSGVAYALAGDFDEALAAADRHREIADRVGARRDAAEYQARALVACAAHDHDRAIEHARQAVECAAIGPFRASALSALAQVELAAGHPDAARAPLGQLADLARQEGLLFAAADAQQLAARVGRALGDLTAADTAAHHALIDAARLGASITTVDALETIAGLLSQSKNLEIAVRLLGAANTIRDTTGYQLCLADREADLADLQEHLGMEKFEAAYTAGRGLMADEAVAYARRGRGERKRPTSGWDSLTPAEAQIVDLVRQGHSNSQIGEQLFISPRTVQTHLTQIYAKLSVKGRTQLAAQATDRLT
jgi:predicted ATPase/class 3 adenylate cyclase/DNA-binding CsgD family transcriptional regulator